MDPAIGRRSSGLLIVSALMTAFLARGSNEIGLSPPCSQVVILEGEQDRHLASGMMFEQSVTLVKPGPYQLAATQAALSKMTPMLCQSIGRIAFGNIPENKTLWGAVNSFGAGDLILINTGGELDEDSLGTMISRRLFLQRTIIHEAGHSAETLLNLESSAPPKNYGGAWGFPARTMADKTIEHVRLEKGLTKEWKRLHVSFVNHGWAVDYPSLFEDPDSRKKWTRRQVTEGGFMSLGGSKNWAEDIATFIGSTYLSQTITDAYREHGVSEDLREDLGCQEMQAYDEKNLPSRFAALYTKLLFVRDLGLVKAADVRACMGENLGLPSDGEGFHFWQGTMKLHSFESQIKADIGTKQNGVPVFRLKGSGEATFAEDSYPANLTVRLALGGRFDELDRVSWPRGVYDLGLKGDNDVELRLDGAEAGDFDTMDGIVLVTEASNDRIVGSIVLERILRSHAPQPIQEELDPPLIIRFMIKK